MSRCGIMRLMCAAMLVWIAGALQGLCETRHVLVLYDERTELPGLAMIDAGIARALASSPERIEIYREAMDNSRFDSPAHRNHLRDHLRAKYAGKRIDVAVAVMEPALNFLLSHRATLFADSPQVPIVFCGIDRRAFGDRPLAAGVTGVLLKREFAPTLRLALSLHQDTKQVYVIGGSSDFDTNLLKQAQEEFRSFENQLRFTYSIAQPLGESLSELSRLPPHTLVLYTTMLRDGANQPYIPHEVAERISAAANAPVYGFVDQYLGRGIVGGHLYRLGTHGEAAGGLVVKILAGDSPAELPPIASEIGATMFDWRQLQRWKISEGSLPPGSIIQFRETTMWERYKGRIIAAIVVVLFQALIISVLLGSLIRTRRAEQSLRESESRFQIAADTAPVMISMSGPDKQCTFLNKGWFEFTGRTPEQELGSGWTKGIHPEDSAACLRTYEESFDARREFTMEYRLRKQNGSYAWVIDIGTPRFLADGRFAGYVRAVTEITELKQAQERWRSVVEGAPNAMVMANEDGKITLVNARTEAVFGYSRSELIGQPVEMLLPEALRAGHPKRRNLYLTNPNARELGADGELFGLRKNGTPVPVEIGLNPIRTPEGRFVLASIIDITERLKTEANLRESDKRMAMVADAANLGMWFWDAPDTFMWASEKWKAIFGYAPGEDIRYDALIERIHPEDRETVERALAEAFNDRGTVFVEHRLLLPDGTVRWISTSGRLERTADNDRLRMLGVSIDVTDRKETEEAAREVSGKLITAQEDERRRIARDLHDDLNQRLALLSVEADLLGHMNNEPPAQALIADIASRVQDLSSEVHKLSYQLHPAKLDQLGLVSATRSFCQEVSKQRRLPVEFVHDDIPRELDRDVALCLYRIIQEGLQNVVKHSRATQVRVELRQRERHLVLVVSDNGRGFDATAIGDQQGLGLVGMRERVRLVHGQISFHAVPGRGTRIEVSILREASETIRA